MKTLGPSRNSLSTVVFLWGHEDCFRNGFTCSSNLSSSLENVTALPSLITTLKKLNKINLYSVYFKIHDNIVWKYKKVNLKKKLSRRGKLNWPFLTQRHNYDQFINRIHLASTKIVNVLSWKCQIRHTLVTCNLKNCFKKKEMNWWTERLICAETEKPDY